MSELMHTIYRGFVSIKISYTKYRNPTFEPINLVQEKRFNSKLLS